MRKATQQRHAILQTLISAGRPLPVAEILHLAQSTVTGLGIATVYRNLKVLKMDGQVAQVKLPGEPPRWEISEGHHHHFLCRTCDKLFEVHDCPEDLARILPDGYVLEEHDILLRGLCDVCAGRPTQRL
jgi:Fur family ferric uptake transcriptional regulator